MMRDLVCSFPQAHEALAEADHAYGNGKTRLCDLIYPLNAFTPEERAANEAALRATNAAQPALGAVSLGAWRVLESFGVRADAFAGHSYGELTALCAAGRISPADLNILSLERGRLMAAAPSDGAAGGMLAVQASAEAVSQVLTEDKIDLVTANKNTPSQTVLSGLLSEIERATAAFADRNVRTTRLSVAAAFHSPQVAHAEPAFRAVLNKTTIHPGAVPVYANTTATTYPEDADKGRDLLAGQLARPVEWVAEIENLFRSGVRVFLEVGPGARLTGMVGAILNGREHEALALDPSSGQRSGLFDLACCLACLAVLGYGVDVKAWDAGAPPRPPADGKPTLLVPICGANYRKAKPSRPPIRTLTPPARPVASAPVLSVEHRHSPNGSSSLTMNGSLPPPQAAPPIGAPSVDTSAVQQALRETRESLSRPAENAGANGPAASPIPGGPGNGTPHRPSARRAASTLFAGRNGRDTGNGAFAAVALSSALGCRARCIAARPAFAGCRRAGRTGAGMRGCPAPIADNGRVERVLLEVIAEKTGYPTEMLDLDMAMDADLGIDSIKRVEILSALQERLPEAPQVKPEHLGTLHNLRDIAVFLADSTATAVASGGRQPPDMERNQGADAPRSPANLDKVTAVLLEVIAEKTGYPTEMLDLDMAMDADLGIDSIKRVEILSALQERLPEAPQVKPEHLGTLHNLRDIAVFLADSPATAVASGGRQPPDMERNPGADAPRSPALERSIVSVAARRRSTAPADPYRGRRRNLDCVRRFRHGRARRRASPPQGLSYTPGVARLVARHATACFTRRFDNPGVIGTNRRRPPKGCPFRRQASRPGPAQRRRRALRHGFAVGRRFRLRRP